MPNRVLVTGGGGQLARALLALDATLDAPPKARLDVGSYDAIEAYCASQPPAVIIHAGAVTNKFKESVDEEYVRTNIIGTANVVLWCMRHRARLVYLSTDYVYPGERGGYSEESVLLPVNRYAKSKLGGEMAAQLYDGALIIRTSFYSSLPFDQACTDQYTSRLPLKDAAEIIYQLALKSTVCGIVNVGAPEARSLQDIVRKEFNPRVQACRRTDLRLPYRLPPDSSLNVAKLASLLPGTDAASASRETCRICGARELFEYLNLGATPLANAYLQADELAQPEFKEELALRLCERCGLSQLSKAVHPDRMFRHYLYVSSTTETFREHCKELAASAMARVQAAPGDWVVDIASNDGCLLGKFQDRGMNVVGVDPAENLAKEANAAGIQTLCAYWSRGMASDVMSRFAPPKIITATNVMAHIDDVHEAVAGVALSLAPGGALIVECPYVIDFIERNEFDTAYHEHLSYLSVRALSALAARHGLDVFDVEYFEEVHGGTIRVWICRPHEFAVTPNVGTFLAKEDAFGLTRRAPYEAFARRVAEHREELVALLKRLRGEGKTVWAYGASAKGNTLVNCFGITRELVPVAIDDNPRKWGYYTPGVHMRIAGITELAKARADYLLLLAWNFKDEIIERCHRAGYQGGFILPVPQVTVLERSMSQHEGKGACSR